MNSKKASKVAARLLTQKNPKNFEFDMSVYRRSDYKADTIEGCGTAGCIAGMTCAALGRKYNQMSWEDIFPKAMVHLDISRSEAERLFEPSINLDEVTELQAGRVLAHFIRTNIIDWNKRDQKIRIAGRVF